MMGSTTSNNFSNQKHSMFNLEAPIHDSDKILELSLQQYTQLISSLYIYVVMVYVIWLLARIIRGRNVSVEVKKQLRNSILLPTLTYG